MEKRTKDNPWKLKTPPQTSAYEMYVDEKDGKEILVCTVGKTVLHYEYRCLADCHEMLKTHGDWMVLGSKDEKQETKEGDTNLVEEKTNILKKNLESIELGLGESQVCFFVLFFI